VIEALRIAWTFRRFFAYGVLVLVIAWLWVSNTGLERDLAEQKLAYTKLEADVAIQNEKIAGYEKVAAERKAIAEKAMEVALASEKKHADKATRILLTQAGDSDQCKAAFDLLREYQ